MTAAGRRGRLELGICGRITVIPGLPETPKSRRLGLNRRPCGECRITRSSGVIWESRLSANVSRRAGALTIIRSLSMSPVTVRRIIPVSARASGVRRLAGARHAAVLLVAAFAYLTTASGGHAISTGCSAIQNSKWLLTSAGGKAKKISGNFIIGDTLAFTITGVGFYGRGGTLAFGGNMTGALNYAFHWPPFGGSPLWIFGIYPAAYYRGDQTGSMTIIGGTTPVTVTSACCWPSPDSPGGGPACSP